MAYTVMTCSYGLYGDGMYSDGLWSYGRCRYGLCSYGLYRYGLREEMVENVGAQTRARRRIDLVLLVQNREF